MPLDRQAALQLWVLLLALPMQMLISSYFSVGDETQRTFLLKRMITSASVFKKEYFSWEKWGHWCWGLLEKVKKLGPHSIYEASDDEDIDLAESPATDRRGRPVDPDGFFAASQEPRSPRPPHVKYRVGQVIKHKKYGYRGVIIGWDPVTKAPESWLKQMHPPDKKHWRHRPSYSVLVDSRDRSELQTTYVAEENIETVTSTKVLHPAVADHFEKFDGAQYIPRPWLRKIYPHD